MILALLVSKRLRHNVDCHLEQFYSINFFKEASHRRSNLLRHITSIYLGKTQKEKNNCHDFVGVSSSSVFETKLPVDESCYE